MRPAHWQHRMVGMVGVLCLIGVQAISVAADEGHGGKQRGQMHRGHDQGEQDEHRAHYLNHLLKHAKDLGLTPDQIGKVKDLQLDLGRTQARAEAEIKIAKLELHALLEDDQADLSAIQGKVDQLKKAEGALVLAFIKGKRNAMAVLTPEQREKDRAHRERMKSGDEAQHEGGGGRGGKGRGGMGGGQGGHGGGGERGGGEHQH